MDTAASIAFIGGGNMAAGLIGGLIHGHWPAAALSVSDPLDARRRELARRFGVGVYGDNAQCAERGDVVVLAVKPRFLPEALDSIAAALGRRRPLVISIVAGVRCEDVLRRLGGPLPLVRAMPNTPALVNAGMTGLFATEGVSREQRDLAQTILRAVGETVWVERESLMDVVTAVSGSGPAYFFKLMELLAQSAVRHGLDRPTAEALAVHTALGAATLAARDRQPPAALRRQVTSPGGTTEAALEKMQALGLEHAVEQAVAAALERAQQLADQFGAR